MAASAMDDDAQAYSTHVPDFRMYVPVRFPLASITYHMAPSGLPAASSDVGASPDVVALPSTLDTVVVRSFIDDFAAAISDLACAKSVCTVARADRADPKSDCSDVSVPFAADRSVCREAIVDSCAPNVDFAVDKSDRRVVKTVPFAAKSF